jgi:phospholipid:diacylglycerol acyltransferase
MDAPFDADQSRRLSYYNLEIRDNYYSRLKAKIELMVKHNGQKVALCSHS